MDRSTWKKFERRVSAFFGTVRNALSGRNSKVSASDSHHPTLFIECKLNSKSPFWTLYLKTREHANKEGKIPVLALGNKNHEGFLVVVHSNDLPSLIAVSIEEKHRQAVALVPPPRRLPVVGPIDSF